MIRHPIIQTGIPVFFPPRHGRQLAQATHKMMLHVAGGIRLQGYYTPQPATQSKGVVLLLHGWLGNANSGYAVAMGSHLYERGYGIFRLNLRDHGETQALNPGVFRGDVLDEVFAATQHIAQLEPTVPLHVVGVSLGGNFALRLAWRQAQQPILNFGHTVLISPLINGYHGAQAIDHGPFIYLYFFRRYWRRALRLKEQAFPERYDFSAELAASTCLGLHEAFVRQCTPYATVQAYFASYAITPAMMQTLASPVTIIAAQDDSIVPVQDISALQGSTPHLTLYLQPYGGHVGFIDLFPFRYWLCTAIEEILAAEDEGGIS